MQKDRTPWWVYPVFPFAILLGILCMILMEISKACDWLMEKVWNS